jgi:gamma-glutamylputrescine oxidase
MSTSYWLDRTNSNNKKTYDIVIVGAGISGLSTAYWLNKEDPSLKIAIVEKQRLGFGASGRNAGFVTCGSVEHFNRLISKHGQTEAVEIWKFAETNLKLLQEHIILDHSQKIEFEKRGAYSLAAQENEFTELKNVAKTMAELNIPTETYSSSEIEKNVGAVNFVGGIKYLDDAETNPMLLLELMRTKINVDLFEQTEAYKYESTPEGTRILKTDQGDFECSMLIYCLNGYSTSLHPYFDDKIYATRAQILMMEKAAPFMDGPCYANFYLDYFRQMPNGALLIGGFRQLEKATEVGYSDHVTDVIQNALHDFVKTHLPTLKDKPVTHRWSGVMGFSKDGQPLIGSLPEDNQVYFVGGYTGHGMGLAFNTGKSLVDMIFGREVPKWLSARRFS